jgi:hypothetical protein
MYRVRWRLLLVLVGVLVVVPTVVSIVSGVNVLPLAIGWTLILLVGAGRAGLRARGSVYQAPEQDFERREADRQFERPPNEGDLL